MMDAQQITPMLDRVTAAAQPNAAFSAPVESNGYTVITASEVASGGGFGFGGGSAPSSEGGEISTGSGSGGGGGGGSMSRPVAAIVIGPEGVKIRPIVDVTKLAIAGITAWGAMAIALGRMSRR
jgi:uncharacterized spore protein YtfJ